LACRKLTYYQNTCIERSRNTELQITCIKKELSLKKSNLSTCKASLYGESFFERRSTWNTPYKFNAKELDEETGMYYYGARYYTPDVSIWLSVDPANEMYPSTSPFMYVRGNPVRLIDPNGMWDSEPNDGQGSSAGDPTHYVDERGNTIVKTEDGINEVVVIKEENEEQFIKEIKEADKQGKAHNPEVNTELSKKYGFKLAEMKNNMTPDYPLYGNRDFGFEVGYVQGYDGISKGRKLFEDITDVGMSNDDHGYVLGKQAGRKYGTAQKKQGKMDMFNPQIKNNFPKIYLNSKSPHLDEKHMKNQY
jgi:RHS repeat-associated protein